MKTRGKQWKTASEILSYRKKTLYNQLRHEKRLSSMQWHGRKHGLSKLILDDCIQSLIINRLMNKQAGYPMQHNIYYRTKHYRTFAAAAGGGLPPCPRPAIPLPSPPVSLYIFHFTLFIYSFILNRCVYL